MVRSAAALTTVNGKRPVEWSDRRKLSSSPDVATVFFDRGRFGLTESLTQFITYDERGQSVDVINGAITR